MMLPSRSKNLNIAIQKSGQNLPSSNLIAKEALLILHSWFWGAFEALFASEALVGIPFTVSWQILDGAFPYSR